MANEGTEGYEPDGKKIDEFETEAKRDAARKRVKEAIKESKKSRSELAQERRQKEEKEHEDHIAAIRRSISSVEEWQTTLSQRYKDLYNVVQKQLPNLWHSLEFDLSIKNILHVKGCSLPFAGMLI